MIVPGAGLSTKVLRGWPASTRHLLSDAIEFNSNQLLGPTETIDAKRCSAIGDARSNKKRSM